MKFGRSTAVWTSLMQAFSPVAVPTTVRTGHPVAHHRWSGPAAVDPIGGSRRPGRQRSAEAPGVEALVQVTPKSLQVRRQVIDEPALQLLGHRARLDVDGASRAAQEAFGDGNRSRGPQAQPRSARQLANRTEEGAGRG